MKEARIIVPQRDNEGQPIDAAHDFAKRRLCVIAGGFTATKAEGGWYDQRSQRLYVEPVIAYDAAVDPDDGNAAADLHTLAVDLIGLARQEAIYLRHASGEVEIVEAPRRLAAAE